MLVFHLSLLIFKTETFDRDAPIMKLFNFRTCLMSLRYWWNIYLVGPWQLQAVHFWLDPYIYTQISLLFSKFALSLLYNIMALYGIFKKRYSCIFCLKKKFWLYSIIDYENNPVSVKFKKLVPKIMWITQVEIFIQVHLYPLFTNA